MSRNLKRQEGFTLIEIAISILVLGILIASGLSLYASYKENRDATRTKEVIGKLASVLYEYKNANGRYPCPAPILENKDTSPNYGHETDCADPNIGTANIVPPGQCLDGTTGPDNFNGICVESSPRLINGNNPRVRVGAIPFRTLQLDEKDTVDGYGSRIVYAVTETMAVAATYKDSEAAIELQDGAGNVIAGNDRSLAFIVVSPGKNKNGAVTSQGVATPCNNGANILDSQNCRDFTINTDTQAIYVADFHSSGTTTFDDIIEYFVPTDAEVWRRQSQTSENIIDMSENRVGVGVIDPDDITEELTVAQSTVNIPTNTVSGVASLDFATASALNTKNAMGDNNQSGGLRVGRYNTASAKHEGKILADNYCTKSGVDCFEPRRIAGNYDGDPVNGVSGMGCPAGQYMTGISDGRAACAPIRIACPSGQVLTGINSSGNVTCAAASAGCAATTKTLCGTQYTLDETAAGQFEEITHTNSCAYKKYRCETNGTWTDMTPSRGTLAECNFDQSNPGGGTNTNQSCSTKFPGYTGTFSAPYTRSCSTTTGIVNNFTNIVASEVCTCIGQTLNINCSAAFGGNKVGTKQRACTNNVLDTNDSNIEGTDGTKYTRESDLIAAKCTCNKNPEYYIYNCPDGMTRKSDPAVLNLTDPPTPWPSEPDRGAYKSRDVIKATCSYTGWSSENTTNCVCKTGKQPREIDPPCVDACHETETPSIVMQERTGTNCAWTDIANDPGNTTGTCRAKTYIWKNSGVAAGPSKTIAEGNDIYDECGSSCSCGESGHEAICAVSNSSSWNFYKATCSPR